MAVMGERELALGMMGYALRSLGLHEDKVRMIVQRFRVSGDEGNGSRAHAARHRTP